MNSGRIFCGLLCAALTSLCVVRSAWTAPVSEVSFDLPWSSTINIVPMELSPLSTHDVVLIIDKSHSMAIADCFPVVANNKTQKLDQPMSRWRWCHEQTLQLAKKSKVALPNALTVVLFAKTFTTLKNSDPGALETIFASIKPAGSTDAAAAVSSQIEDYFTKRSNLGDRIKPLLIAIISDGCPDNPKLLCHVISQATQRMNKPGEIAITFLQVGNDRRAIDLLEQLRNGLLDQNAKFNIVSVIPFPELNKIGLPQALVNVTSDHPNAQAARFSL